MSAVAALVAMTLHAPLRIGLMQLHPEVLLPRAPV
jgi:hypothetical protein